MRLKPFLNLLYPSKTFIRYYSQEYVPQALRSLKGKSNRAQVQYYKDRARVKVVGGNGGDGCISFLHAWCKDQAGPDGGDGGNGGHIIFQASHSVKSLNHVHTVVRAKHGEKGFNKDCAGKNAQHVVVPVPVGTIIYDAGGVVVGELSVEGAMWVGARGGRGGRGNKFFLTDVLQGPEIAEFGAEGETHTYTLEVKSMAHIGLIGFPNAGKSTLLRAITRARPKVAPYPFTTLRPHIGMVEYDDYEQIAVADLPGLIPGSHKNRGLGIQFLQHAERCRGLLYILDGLNDPISQYNTLTYELGRYSTSLTDRPKCVIVNKIDEEEGLHAFGDVKRMLCNTYSREDGKVHSNSDMNSKEDVKVDSYGNMYSKEDVKVNSSDNMYSKEDGMVHSNGNMYSKEDGKVHSNGDVLVLGISAKTGKGLSALLNYIRQISISDS